jgi:hypothetical protein
MLENGTGAGSDGPCSDAAKDGGIDFGMEFDAANPGVDQLHGTEHTVIPTASSQDVSMAGAITGET